MACNQKISFGAVVAIAIGIATALAVAFTSHSNAGEPHRFEIERFGDPDGQPVVFIPGLGTPGDVWFDSAQALEGADAYVLSVAGFGGVPAAAPADNMLQAVADELADWLAETDLSDATLVGHSLGGQIALKAAAQASGVARVMVVDSAPFFARLRNPGADPSQVAAFEASMRQQMAGADDAAFTAMVSQGLSIQATDPDDQQQVLAWAQASDRATFAKAMSEVFARDYRPGLEQVEAPVRVLVAHSDMTPISADQLVGLYETQYQSLSRVEIQLISDSRHFIMLDQPGALQAELAEFLEMK